MYERAKKYLPDGCAGVVTFFIKGGKNAGIKTCLFNPEKKKISGDVIPDFEISSLSELPALIKTF